jgi:hypothetical protein
MPHYTQFLGPRAVDILASVWPSSRWPADYLCKLAVRLNIILGLFGVPFQTKDVLLSRCPVVSFDDEAKVLATPGDEVFR